MCLETSLRPEDATGGALPGCRVYEVKSVFRNISAVRCCGREACKSHQLRLSCLDPPPFPDVVFHILICEDEQTRKDTGGVAQQSASI